MRRYILITINTLYLVCCGLWMGGILGVGAYAAPAAFKELSGIERDGVPIAGFVVGHALRTANTVSIVMTIVMLALAAYELFYRKRLTSKRPLLARLAMTVVAFLLTLYLANVMMPRMELVRSLHDMRAFDDMHVQYRRLSSLQVLIGIVLILLTNTVNIGPRRDGGHSRNH